MPTFERGDIVRVPFPYVDRPIRQHRPAVVVSRAPLGQDGGLLWVLMITSAANRAWPSDVAVAAGRETGLPVDSLVRTAKIATIETGHAERIGRLPATTMEQVTERLRATIS